MKTITPLHVTRVTFLFICTFIIFRFLHVKLVDQAQSEPLEAKQVQAISDSSQPSANIPRSDSPPPPIRDASNILFWSQEKTASTSTKLWLQGLADAANLSARFYGATQYFHGSRTDLSSRAKDFNCTIIGGHIFTRDIYSRDHEAAKGVVIATSRDTKDLLCSKYFHFSEGEYDQMVEELRNVSSTASWKFSGRFRMYDPCELYRYYDGLHGCDVEESKLTARAEAIAERLDCVIDTDDPQKDANAICELIKVKECPVFVSVNVRARKEGGYTTLLSFPHIQQAMAQPVRVVEILRQALMKRRCRFLTDGSRQDGEGATMSSMAEPTWPSACRTLQ